MKILKSLVIVFTMVLVFNSSFIMAQSVDWKWCKGATGIGKDEASAIATDESGNIYVAGSFRSAAFNLGTFTLTNPVPTTTEIFLAKYNSSGALLWAKSIGNKGNELVTDICTDATGNIYMSGNFESDTVNFGKGVIILNSSVWVDPFVAKFTSAGDIVWASSAGGATLDYAQGVAVDMTGNVYMTGYFDSDTLVFSNPPLTQINRAGVFDAYIAKYNSYGDFQWVRGAGGEMEDEALAVTVDNLGNAIITGYFQSSNITFGDYPLTNANNWSDLFITKYNSSGVVLWAKIITGEYYETGNAITTDGSGNIYVAGNFSSDNITIGSASLNNAFPGDNSDDIFVAKYNSSGIPQWANNAGGTAYDYAKGIAVDNSGNVYITGNFVSPTLTVGGNVLNNTDTKGSGEIYAVKYNSTGGVVKALSAQSNGDDDARAIASFANNAFIAGTHKANPKIYFGSNFLQNSGDYDIVVAAFGFGTSIKDEEFDRHFSVFPNPVNDQFSLTANEIASGKYNCKMYDVTGKLMHESTIDFKQNNTQKVSVPTSYKGLLMLMITSDNGQVYTRSVICY